jgi:hypothetical protein
VRNEKADRPSQLIVSHSLGPLERIQKRHVILSGEKIEPYPVATFHFKYRSQGREFKTLRQNWMADRLTHSAESLKQLLVIPRSPSPTPLEERDPKDLTPAEARELIRRQRVRDPFIIA